MSPIRLPRRPLADGVVSLRPWRRSDLPALVAACRDPEIPRWTRVPSPYTLAHGRSFLAQERAGRRAGKSMGLAVTDARSGELLGAIGFVQIDRERRAAEIGYWLARHARGRGVAVRAVRLLSRFTFTRLGMARIELLAHPQNVASCRVAERAGFTREGVLRSHHALKGKRSDAVIFSLLPDDPPPPDRSAGRT